MSISGPRDRNQRKSESIEMENLLKKRRVEGSAVAQKNEDLTDFRSWLISNRCEFLDRIEFNETESDGVRFRGTFANTDIKIDSIITRIPASLMMPSGRARRTKIGVRLEARAVELGLKPSNHTFLSAWLMYQRFLHIRDESLHSALKDSKLDEDSSEEPNGGWGPYIRVLPREYSDPTWWTSEVLADVHFPFLICFFLRQSMRAHNALVTWWGQ
jgi:hypothetical protein